MTRVEQIEICDPAQDSPNPEEIRICDPAQDSDAPEEVKICHEATGNCPPGTPELVISGSLNPAAGSVYSVTGGVGPFTWTVTGGAGITKTGPRTAELSDVDGNCGMGEITVTDETCGTSATLQFAYPIGQWVQINAGVECLGQTASPFTCWGSQCDLTYTDGPYKITGSLVCCQTTGGCDGDGHGHEPDDAPPMFSAAEVHSLGYCSRWTCSDEDLVFSWKSWRLYRWECP